MASASASSPSNLTPTNITIATLPTDVFLLIIEQKCITRRDIISLRFSCKALSDAVIPKLFTSVRISQLKHDRETFLAVCHSPHLAPHIRTVEWQDIAWLPGSLRGLSTVGDVDDELDEMCIALEDLANDLFWLTWKNPAAKQESQAQPQPSGNDIIANFRQEFIAALSLLPRLHTAISRPMPQDRLLSWCKFPMNAGMFQGLDPAQGYRRKSPLPHTEPNCGLLSFILPAMDELKMPITRLMWEENFTMTHDYTRFLPVNDALRHLNHLSISVTTMTDDQENHEPLANFIDSCSNVKHLSLVNARILEPDSVTNFGETILFKKSPLGNQITSRCTGLVSVMLRSISFVCDNLPLLAMENAGTLRHLVVVECQISLTAIKNLGLVSGLKLDSVSIKEPVLPDRFRVAREDKLLDFLNQDHESIEHDKKEKLKAKREGYSPDPSVFWYSAFLKPEDCMAAKSHYIVVTSPKGTLEMPDYYKWGDREGPEEEEKEALNSDGCCSETGSDDTFDLRHMNGPSWAWNTFFHRDRECGEVFYWEVNDDEYGASPTKIWRFTSREGTVVYGNDPYRYFEEWDVEMGDKEKPLPYCDELQFDATESLNPPTIRWHPDEEPPMPPDGAIQYDFAEAEEAM